MALSNPFKITYGSQAVGGSSDTYLLHGPQGLEKSFDGFSMAFDVVVVGTSYENLQNLCETLEDAFRKRDQDLVVDLDNAADPAGDSTWTYTSGSTILNTRASLTKTGDPESDRGYSRAYSCVIEGELPVDDQSAAASAISGMREIEWSVDYEAGRQKIVSCTGVYTATETPANLATANYTAANGADIEASTFLAALDNTATFELVDEQYSSDRNDHNCTFSRRYVEILENQTAGVADDGDIRDHRIVFSDRSLQPGDSGPEVYRLRSVVASYDCAIDIDQTTDLQTTYTTKIKPHVLELFRSKFDPQVLCIEEQGVSYDETAKRLSATIKFLYQPSGGSTVVESVESMEYRETRTIDYTPLHNQGEYAAEADTGWAVRERVFTHTTIALGRFKPRSRIGPIDGRGGGRTIPLGALFGTAPNPGPNEVRRSGWNIIANNSRVTPQWIGDPDEEQLEVTVLTETVVERYNDAPGRR